MSAPTALLARELRLALRAGGGAGLGLAFFLVVVMLIPFGIGPSTTTLREVAPGVLWVAALLATLLSLDRLFQQDAEDGTLDILALSPLPLEMLVAVKMLAHWLTTGLPLLIAAPVLAITLNLA
ncbi:MAG: heme exporter protein CcmB, partial [Pseudomonadota bacterium]